MDHAPDRSPSPRILAPPEAGEPSLAVEVHRPDGRAPVLLLCDHAGRIMPAYLGDLGVPEAERRRHIGWDIGAADVARELADLLDAALVLCHVTRLVIDVNRRPYRPTSVPEVSDGTPVPGNRGLDAEESRRHIRGSFLPYHRAIACRLLSARDDQPCQPAGLFLHRHSRGGGPPSLRTPAGR